MFSSPWLEVPSFTSLKAILALADVEQMMRGVRRVPGVKCGGAHMPNVARRRPRPGLSATDWLRHDGP
jgi:hypothetical protein